MTTIQQKHCLPCEGIGKALKENEAQAMMKQLSEEWRLENNAKSLVKDYRLKNYYHTIAFVNAIAWMANIENHHPDLEVGYNHCLVRYSTHALNGLTENDFICAAKIDGLFQPYSEKNYDRKP